MLIRTDASAAMGTGHLSRCLNLAAALRNGGAEVTFACAATPVMAAELVSHCGFEVGVLQNTPRSHAHRTGDALSPSEQSADADATIAVATRPHFDWAIVDHYGLGAEWERRIRTACHRVAAIDDLANRPHDCDVLLDQNLRPDGGAAYNGLLPLGCELLVGPRYALIDAAFSAARTALQAHSQRTGVLVSFGGSDAQSLTRPVLRALQGAVGKDCRVDVVVGALNSEAAAVRDMAAGMQNVHVHHATHDMAGLMARAQLFVGAGGVTSWERCCLALPGVVVSTAANQELHCRALDDAGSHVYLGDASETSPEAIAQAAVAVLASAAWQARLADRSLAIVDGLGARRVAARLGAGEVRLREATVQDEESILRWRNDPAVRRHAGTPGEIDRSEHADWFARVLADPDRHLLVADDARGACGVLRYDITRDTAQVSIYVVPQRMGAGMGTALLAAGERWLAAHRPEVTAVRAEVQADNRASIRLFTSAGFRTRKMSYVKDLSKKGGA